MKFKIVCIFCSKVIQKPDDKDAPTSYVICDDCKAKLKAELGLDAIIVQKKGG